MRYNKFKAFTIAEIMVILLTLSILLAAFAPVFTRRYNNVTSNEVWTYVPGDDNYNAYFDTPNKLFLNQAFVGLTPISSDEVRSFSGGDSCEVCITNLTTGAVTCASASCSAAAASPKPIYSKLVIAASKELGSITNDPPQNQMQFRMATSNTDAAGTVVGSLFAGNNNMLLGGPYVDIKNDAVANSAFGAGSLKSLTKGDANNIEDPSLVNENNIYGRVILKIPKLGYIRKFLLTSYGFLFGIVLPASTIIIFDILKFIKKCKNKQIDEEIDII